MGKHLRRHVTRSNPILRLPQSAPAPKRIGRRDFVRTASGILAAATVSSACGGDAGPPNGGDQPAFIFTSDFGTSRGTDATSLTDGGRWNGVWGGVPSPFGGGHEVIAATGLDFPTPNCYVKYANPDFGGVAVRGLGAPGIGATRYYRWYWRHHSQGSDDNTHPLGSGDGNPTVWQLNIGEIGGPQTRFLLQLPSSNGGDFGHYIRCTAALAWDTTYRWELQITRADATHFRCHARVYNSAGTLIASDADFQGIVSGRTLATDPLLLMDSYWPEMDGWYTGNNGIAGGGSGVYAWSGAYATSDEDWCGPYVARESP